MTGLREVLHRLVGRVVADTPELLAAQDTLRDVKRRREAIVAEQVRRQAEAGQARIRHHAGGR